MVKEETTKQRTKKYLSVTGFSRILTKELDRSVQSNLGKRLRGSCEPMYCPFNLFQKRLAAANVLG